LNRSSGSRGAAILKWGGTLLSVILLIYLLSQQGWAEIGQAVSQIPVWRFAVAILLILISRFAVIGRWHVLLQATSEKVAWGQTARLTFAGLFATNFLPTTIGGDIVRLAGAVQQGMSGAIVTASLMVDRLVGMLGMVLVAPLGILPLLDWITTRQAGSGLLGAPALLIAANSPFKKIWQKTVSILQKIFRALKFWWQQPVSLLKSFLFTGIHMVCFFGILWILFGGLNDPISFGLVAGLYSFVYLVTLLPISINSYGLQEVSISLIFTHVGGVSMQSALTVALIFRTLTLLASLPGAIFVPDIIVGHKQTETEYDAHLQQDEPTVE